MAKLIPKSVYMRKIEIAKRMYQGQLKALATMIPRQCNCNFRLRLCFFHSKVGA